MSEETLHEPTIAEIAYALRDSALTKPFYIQNPVNGKIILNRRKIKESGLLLLVLSGVLVAAITFMGSAILADRQAILEGQRVQLKAIVTIMEGAKVKEANEIQIVTRLNDTTAWAHKGVTVDSPCPPPITIERYWDKVRIEDYVDGKRK